MKDLTNNIVIQKDENNISYLQFRILNEYKIKNAYTLKNNILNYRHSEENIEMEKQSYMKICNALNVDVNCITKPMQNHTKNVRIIDKTYLPEELKDIDGLITAKENILLSTTNADCILYLLYDKKNKVIANVHSGWKGSYQGIIEAAIEKMVKNFKTNPKDIIVCICPSIRKCCFEVQEDVKDMFYEKYSYLENINEFIVKNESNKYLIDTVGINNCLLINKGILKENIYDSNICSKCNKDIIHSYRAEGKDYKLATAVIGM